MGTRAIITVKEKPFVATHWDGDPTGLGAHLLKARTLAQIIKVAQKHTIVCADIKHAAFKPVMETRFSAIAKKAKKPVQYVKNLFKKDMIVTFQVMGPDDEPISPMSRYGDWAEWQYDYDNGAWKGRKLSGAWPKSKKTAGAWHPLRELVADEQVKRDEHLRRIEAEHAAKQKAAKK
jgi:hypothetical protein